MTLTFYSQGTEIDTQHRGIFYLTGYEPRRSFIETSPKNGLYFMLNNKALLSII